MEQQYLIDTNVVIAFLGNKLSDDQSAFLENQKPVISVISRIELLGWLNGTDTELKVIQSFVSDSYIFPLDEQVILATIRLHQKNKIKLPDAIIAATALAHNLTLISRNTKDFEKIEGLKTLNPFI